MSLEHKDRYPFWISLHYSARIGYRCEFEAMQPLILQETQRFVRAISLISDLMMATTGKAGEIEYQSWFKKEETS